VRWNLSVVLICISFMARDGEHFFMFFFFSHLDFFLWKDSVQFICPFLYWVIDLNSRTEWHHRSNGTDRCRQSIPSCNSIIYILISSPWNFLQNRLYLRAQSKPQEIKENWNYPCILSDHNAIILELNNKRSSREYTNNWRLNNTLLNDQWVIQEIREEIKKFLKFNENENTAYQNLWDTPKACHKRKVYSHECIF
jgi:hypothetical protein